MTAKKVAVLMVIASFVCSLIYAWADARPLYEWWANAIELFALLAMVMLLAGSIIALLIWSDHAARGGKS